MVGEGVGECCEADEPHELVHLMAFLLEHAARDEAGLNVAPDRQPGKKVGVLKDQTAFGVGAADGFIADPKLT